MSERTLKELRNSLKGKIHIYLKDTKTAMQFLIDAENEGYKIGEKKPTECDTDTFFALGGSQLSYLNSIGRICFQCNGGAMSKGKYHRIDYYRYVNGYKNYYYKEPKVRIETVKSIYHGKVDITGDKCEEAAKFFSIAKKSVADYESEENLINLLSEKYDVLVGCEY